MTRRPGRRDFFRYAAALASAWISAAFSRRLEAAEAFFREPPWRKKRPYYGFAVDVGKCIGCGLCVGACKKENEVPLRPFYFRTWVEHYVIRRSGKAEVKSPAGGGEGFAAPSDPESVAKSYFVPKLCNVCEHPPCVQVCPVGATFKTEDGVVLVDRQYCIGCRYCIQACPYGARFFHPYLKVADKCTLCYHRIVKGLVPACVEVCPTGARIFGDLGDPKSRLSKFAESGAVQVLKPHLGTEPKLFYKGLDRDVR